MHQNKGDLNPRGHLGTEAMNKAETVAATTKSDNVTVVTCEQARNIEFEPFAFEIIDGLPVITDVPEKESTNVAIKPELIKKEMHDTVIRKIFNQKLNEKRVI